MTFKLSSKASKKTKIDFIDAGKSLTAVKVSLRKSVKQIEPEHRESICLALTL